MTLMERTLAADAVAAGASRNDPGRRIASVCARIAHWIEVAADHYEAAALYDHLSQLSDAELQRRGLTRESLAHDIGEARATAARPRNLEPCNRFTAPSRSNTP